MDSGMDVAVDAQRNRIHHMPGMRAPVPKGPGAQALLSLHEDAGFSQADGRGVLRMRRGTRKV